MSKASRNREIARARIAEMRAREARQARKRRLYIGIGSAAVVIAVVVSLVLVATGGNGKPAPTNSPTLKLGPTSSLGKLRPAPSPGSDGFEGVPIPDAKVLAGTSSDPSGQKVDGIRCQTGEQSLFHIHSHLSIFVNGTPRQVPGGVGIPGSQVKPSDQGPVAEGGSCLYWLHTHAPDGIIHVESPVHRTFTLGDFFDIWGQPLGPSTLGPINGHVVAIYNGKRYLADPQDIPLNAHAQIQLEVGDPLIAPETITFQNGL